MHDVPYMGICESKVTKWRMFGLVNTKQNNPANCSKSLLNKSAVYTPRYKLARLMMCMPV